jgi:hypothetical protein
MSLNWKMHDYLVIILDIKMYQIFANQNLADSLTVKCKTFCHHGTYIQMCSINHFKFSDSIPAFRVMHHRFAFTSAEKDSKSTLPQSWENFTNS